MLLDEKGWGLVEQVNCDMCPDAAMCDQVKYDCPKIDFKTGTIDMQ